MQARAGFHPWVPGQVVLPSFSLHGSLIWHHGIFFRSGEWLSASAAGHKVEFNPGGCSSSDGEACQSLAFSWYSLAVQINFSNSDGLVNALRGTMMADKALV